jgi:hypothetical protein
MNPETTPEILSLQKQVFGLMIALILVSGTLTYYFYGQARLAHRSVTQANKIIDTMKQNEKLANNFVNQLVAYGQTHPDFRPVLAKYGIAPVPGIPAGSPTGAAPKK